MAADTLTSSAPTSHAAQVAHRLGVDDLDRNAITALSQLIVTIAAHKGGVGKTEIAKELAWLLAGVLVDFDWDRGGASRAWGYRYETRTTAPLIDAMEAGRTPRPLSGGPFRADIVPSHPDWGNNQPNEDHVAAQLERWSQTWRRPLVIDTHPGGGDEANPSAAGAIAAAHIVIVPTVLETRPLEALEGMADELRAFPLLIIPNMVDAAPRRLVDRLQHISETYQIPVGPSIGKYGWLSRRTLRMAVAARTPIPAKNRQFVAEITDVARAVLRHAANVQESRS